uniref:Glycosyl transferase family 2 n=1 Tax=Cyanothece sp. (strain PCC 7425 / ATCC 29141) TaxID=395961 RepID=B8HUJ6_CYAP4
MTASLSVVITCYREGELLFDAVNSVLQQSLQPLEIIIVNDATTDRATIAACQELEHHPLIQVIWRQENGGTSTARNDGFNTAQGEVLVLLDADDILPPEALNHISQTFAQHPDADFIYGNYLRCTQANPAGFLVVPPDCSLTRMLRAKPLSPSSQWDLSDKSPLKKSLWQSIGGYDPEFGVADLHDVEFWLRAIASGCSYYYTDETLYIWRKYLGNNSRQVTPLAWDKLVKKHVETYCQLGLDYRAYELLLLGSKWLRDPEATRTYSTALLKCIRQGRFQFSSLVALLMPTWLFQPLSHWLSKKR